MSNQGPPSDGSAWEHVDTPAGKGDYSQYASEQWAQWSSWQNQNYRAIQAELVTARAALQQKDYALQQALMAAQPQMAAAPGVAAGAAPAVVAPGWSAPAAPVGDGSSAASRSWAKMGTAVLPDPGQGFVQFKRAVDEFVAIHTSPYSSSQPPPPFHIFKSIKDGLPEPLQVLATERFTISDMEQPGSLTTMMDWLSNRYDDFPDVEKRKIWKEWHNFRRSGSDIRLFVDQFEHHLVMLTKVGARPADGDLNELLLIKANLPAQVEHEIRLALQRLCSCLSLATYTFTQLKTELLALSNRPDFLTKRVNIVTEQKDNSIVDRNRGSQPCRHFASGQCHFGDGCKFVHDKGVRQESRFSHYQQERNVHYNESKPQCHYFGSGQRCPYGDQCRYAHSGSRNRSRSPRKGKGDRSRSPRHGKGRDQRDQRCYDYSVGKCHRGAECKFQHQGDTRRTSSSRSPSARTHRTPKGGKNWSSSRSPSRKFAGSPKFGRGSPSRSPRPSPSHR